MRMKMNANISGRSADLVRLMAIASLFFSIAILVSCKQDNLPPLPAEDGKVLFEFLLNHAPDTVLRVPCSCCDHELKWCYNGGCPYT